MPIFWTFFSVYIKGLWHLFFVQTFAIYNRFPDVHMEILKLTIKGPFALGDDDTLLYTPGDK